MGSGGASGACPVLVAMPSLSLAIWITGIVLEAVLLLRGRQERTLSRFPLFFSYIGYALAGSLVAFPVYWLLPNFYPTYYWFYFLVSLLAEFAVVAEISDQIFAPLPAIRWLGRFIVFGISALSLVLYILPSLLRPKPSDAAFLDLTLRLSLAKASIIVVVMAAVRYYRLPLKRNVAGLMLGFGLYLGICIAVYSAAASFGKFYARVLWFASPLGFMICLLVWTIALWWREPIPARIPQFGDRAVPGSKPLSYQLDRFNSLLTRFLQK
jgi:hypothetical protein